MIRVGKSTSPIPALALSSNRGHHSQKVRTWQEGNSNRKCGVWGGEEQPSSIKNTELPLFGVPRVKKEKKKKTPTHAKQGHRDGRTCDADELRGGGNP